MRHRTLFKWTGAFGGVFVVLFLLSSVFAQGWGYGMMDYGSMMNGRNMMGGMMGGMMRPGMMNGMMGNWQNMPKQYRLTPEQRQAIWNIRNEYQPKVLSLNRELNATQLELRGYEARPEADPRKIRDYRNTILELEKKIGDYRLQAREKMNKILTQEQKTYWNGNVGWYDGGWCPMMSGNMMGGTSRPRGMMGY